MQGTHANKETFADLLGWARESIAYLGFCCRLRSDTAE